MRRLIVFGMVILVWVAGFVFDAKPALSEPIEDPPKIGLDVKLSSPAYYPGQPISMTVSAGSAEEVIVAEGLMDTEFYLFLRFYDEWGRVITSDALAGNSAVTPPPPRVFPDASGALPQGTPVEVVPLGWSVKFGPFDAYDYYPLEGRSGKFWVEALVAARSFYSYFETPTGTKYAITYPAGEDQTKWYGSLKSSPAAFTIVGDADGDGYCYPEGYPSGQPADCNDRNAGVHPGAVEIAGNGIDDDCNPSTPDAAQVDTGTLNVLAQRHVVGTGNHPGSEKYPLAGLPLRVYSKAPGSCVSQYGVSWQNYPTVWGSCAQPSAERLTDLNGTAQIQLPVGDYIVIGRHDPDTAVYGNEIYLGVSVGQLDAGATVSKYLQLIQKADGKKVPGKYTKKTGSELLIIEPEYVEWDGTQELYPFIFESIGDWSVTTSVSPPEGFVADQNALSEEVNTEVEAVQFMITDVGSEWTDTAVEHKLTHKGKEEEVKSKIGVKLNKKLAKEKGLSIYGKKSKGK